MRARTARPSGAAPVPRIAPPGARQRCKAAVIEHQARRGFRPRRCHRNWRLGRSAGASRTVRHLNPTLGQPRARSARAAPSCTTPSIAATSCSSSVVSSWGTSAHGAAGRSTAVRRADDLLPAAGDRVGEHQQQVALAHPQRRLDRLLLVRDHGDRRSASTPAACSASDDPRHLVAGAAAQGRRGGRCNGRTRRRSFLAISRRSSSRRSPGPASTTCGGPGIEPLRQVGHHADRGALCVVEITLNGCSFRRSSARGLEEGGVEGAQAVADVVQR